MKHHYVPQFLLRQWADDTERVWSYRRIRGAINVRHDAPAATGYEIDLYAIPSRSNREARQEVETRFMQQVDSLGAQILAEILETGRRPKSASRASAWSRFLMSMINRSPHRIREIAQMAKIRDYGNLAQLEPEYEKARQPHWPPTIYDYVADNRLEFDEEVAKGALKKVIDSKRIGEVINNLIWTVVRTEGSGWPLLLSDAPVTYGNFQNDDAIIIMPIHPKAAFAAARKHDMIEALQQRIRHQDFARQLNKDTVHRARALVIARDRTQDRFIGNRLA